MVLRKTDKSKVFCLDELDNYGTKAYQDVGQVNPLELLIKRTNVMLFGLWITKHIIQKQCLTMKVKEKVELANLCLLPKVHN